MSERIPMGEDIRQALKNDGWTLDEADEGIDRIKHADLIQRLRESADFYERSAADALVVTTLREAADALCMDWERRVEAYNDAVEEENNA